MNFTVSSVGDPYQVGFRTSHSQSSATQQVNELIEVGGTFTVNAHSLTLDGANLITTHLEGHVDTLNIISHADESECKSESYGASTGGDFYMSQQKSSSRMVNHTSELHVRSSINEQPNEFTVGTLNSTGGSIVSDGINHFQSETVHARDVEGYQHSSGYCMSGNVKNYKQDTQTNHLLPADKQSAQITTTTIGFNNSDYQAKHHSVIYGAEGTDISTHNVSGQVVTHRSEGREVTKDTRHRYTMVVPHMTRETEQQFAKNEQWAVDKLEAGGRKVKILVTDFFKPKSEAPKVHSIDPQQADHSNRHPKTHTSHSKYSKETSLEPWQEEALHYYSEEAPIEKENASKPASKEQLKEAYLEGKSAAATGFIPELVNYSDSEKAKFYIGYYEVKGTQDGMKYTAATIPIWSVGGLVLDAIPAIGEMAGNYISLGLRTLGLFKNASDILLNPELKNHISLLRLQEQLSQEECQALFNEDGTLSLDAINN